MPTSGDSFGHIAPRFSLPAIDADTGGLFTSPGGVPGLTDNSNGFGEFSTILAIMCQIVASNQYFRRLLPSAQIATSSAVFGAGNIPCDFAYQGAIIITHGPSEGAHARFSFTELPKYGYWGFADDEGQVYDWEPINHQKQLIHAPVHRGKLLFYDLNPGVEADINIGGLPPSPGILPGDGMGDPWQVGTTDTHDPAADGANNQYFFAWNHTAGLPLLNETTGEVAPSDVNLGYLINFSRHDGAIGSIVNVLSQIVESNLYCHHGNGMDLLSTFESLSGVGEVSGDNLYACDFFVNAETYRGSGFGVDRAVIKAGWMSWIYEEGFASRLFPITAYAKRFYSHHKAPQGVAYYLHEGVEADVVLWRAPRASDITCAALASGVVPKINDDFNQHFP